MEEVTHDEETLSKVYAALRDLGLEPEDANDAILAIQNAGILFRERAEVSA